MADPKINGLKQVSVFSQLTEPELEWLSSRMDEVEVTEGRELTSQGQPGHSFYILLDGAVEAVIDGKTVARLESGDFFGEISMLDRGPATATVTSLTPVRLLVMSHTQFRDAVRSNDQVLAGVMAAMATRLRENQVAGFTRA
jgi:CRP-like cAMP-binding protein